MDKFEKYIEKSSFKEAPDGRKVFFPYGAFGKGRVVDSEATLKKIINHQKAWFSISITFMLIAMHMSMLKLVIAISMMVLTNYLSTQGIIKGLEVSTICIAWGEIRNKIKADLIFRSFTNFLLIFSGLLILFVGMIALFSEQSKDGLVPGIMLTTIGVILLILATHSIRNKVIQQ